MDTESAKSWAMLGSKVPKEEIVYFCQIIVLYFMIGASIYNLTTNNGDSNLWTALLCSSSAYLLPNPKIKRDKISNVLPNITE